MSTQAKEILEVDPARQDPTPAQKLTDGFTRSMEMSLTPPQPGTRVMRVLEGLKHQVPTPDVIVKGPDCQPVVDQ